MMTNKVRIGLVAGAAILLAGGAALYAQPDGGPMKHFDSDGNGAVSLAEARAGAAKMFAGADADKDGRVTGEEMRAFHARMGDHRRGPHGGGEHHGPPPPMGEGGGRPGGPMHLDADGDGAVSLAEAQSGIEQHFARIDSNRDGSITEVEMRAAHEAHRRP